MKNNEVMRNSETMRNNENVMVVRGTDGYINLYNRMDRVKITRSQYHKNKDNFEKSTQIIAIAQKCGNAWNGYNYYVAPEILDQLK